MLRKATIAFNGGRSTLDCIVLDISETGARLKVTDWLLMPDRFELVENGRKRYAEVRHRAPEEAGVHFIDPPGS